MFGWLRRREERREVEWHHTPAGLASGLVWCLYDGDDAVDEYREPPLDEGIRLIEFDGHSLQGAEAVSKRLAARAKWAHAAHGRGSSWSVEDVGRRHVLAIRSLEGRWPPEEERQPRCLIVATAEGKVREIREFQDPDAARRLIDLAPPRGSRWANRRGVLERLQRGH